MTAVISSRWRTLHQWTHLELCTWLAALWSRPKGSTCGEVNWTCVIQLGCVKTRNHYNQMEKCLHESQEFDALCGKLPNLQEGGGSMWKGKEENHTQPKQMSHGEDREDVKLERRKLQGVRRINPSQGNKERKNDSRFRGKGDAITHIFTICPCWPSLSPTYLNPHPPTHGDYGLKHRGLLHLLEGGEDRGVPPAMQTAPAGGLQQSAGET